MEQTALNGAASPQWSSQPSMEQPTLNGAEGLQWSSLESLMVQPALNGAASSQWRSQPSVEICCNPQFIVNGATRTDIKQGALGDCWLLAAIASLTLHPKLLARVVPNGQSFGAGYAGIFHFKFWQFGRWVDVFIDDSLPTQNNHLVFLHSVDRNEFWSALLEKAYAKLNGSYEALKGGSIAEAMEDFTGGVYEFYNLTKASPSLYRFMHKALQKDSMMGCSIDATNLADVEMRLSNGLVKGHAYSITGVNQVFFQEQAVRLVRLRNPWGEVEWNGPWSDDSWEWRVLEPEQRARLQQIRAEDGEFWMSFADFMRNFSKLEVCHLSPDTLSLEDDPRTWTVTAHEGRWLRGCTAGGCCIYPDTFWTNPQFWLRLEEEDDDPENGESSCTFLVALMQKHMRRQKRSLLTIGYTIYEVPRNMQQLSREFFLRQPLCVRNRSYINLREVSEHFQLPPGNYVIVPSTYEPHQEADFLMRVFCEKRNKSKEAEDKIGADFDGLVCAVDGIETEEDRRFKQVFSKLAGEDMEISPRELQNILNRVTAKHGELISDGFSLYACQSMVALMDTDCSGQLGIQEFKILWDKVKNWQVIFRRHDVDHSGTMSSYEMRTALNAAGYHLNNHLYQLITMRYADDTMTIKFNDYITCMVRLEAMFRIFHSLDKNKRGLISLRLPTWLRLTMYA
uniref:calpain-3-like n=1 Tax=Myxine glutinosa TaxID=7769 RepID=UPI00358E7DFA